MEIKPILKIGDTPLTPDEQQIADTAASHLEIARQSIWEINTRLVMEGRPSLEAWYLALQLDNLCDYIEA
ncbi:hypothetical protein HMPREF0578_1883 [Mobiluncus mulieris 28-1]|uniref:Uncharacterized protein n=1 Tax=Mobiluncus mulieris TaxID=2052 RepID=A0A7Y0UVA7_9ACTO|nr:hypothetical protein [Mobiluncus mulieris]EEZ90882.1 hypothetical protein HMPREF0578_1883 [Mobiluncus mulieris 28-1]MBB5845756.1 hypothetical protein [Mobiluncus mulieris]MCU9971130.1 hypothetical protein [Mobiluncus mulieris]MCU9975611.1 hypothetical protein [Mobiluncus mulieris]MCU9994939.1 hypothetical protein [Mobiluncus mulieris]